MGLRDDIQSAVGEALNGDLSDVVSFFDLVKKTTSGAYDPVAGKRSETETKTFSKGIFASFGAREIDNENVKIEDEKLIVNASNLVVDGEQVTPEIDDEIQLEDGTAYIVIQVKPVMGGDTIPVIFVLQIRKNG